MPTDSNVKRQLSGAEQMRRDLDRSIANLNDQIRLLERQDRDSARLPNAGRIQTGIREQIRSARRMIDRHRSDIRVLDRQISELKRMR